MRLLGNDKWSLFPTVQAHSAPNVTYAAHGGACGYDVIVALDEGIRRDLLRAAEAENTSDVRWYSDRLCSISTFSHYLGDEILAGADPALRQSLFAQLPKKYKTEKKEVIFL